MRPLAAFQAVAADQLRHVGREHLDAQVEEAQPPAPFRIAAIVADVVVQRALPVALDLPARDEDHVGVEEALHITAEIAAIPRRLHVGDDLADRSFLDRRIIGLCARRAAHQKQREQGGEQLHAAFRAIMPITMSMKPAPPSGAWSR